MATLGIDLKYLLLFIIVFSTAEASPCSCSAHGNTYIPVSGCSEYTQNGMLQECPDDLLFDTNICSCNWISAVECQEGCDGKVHGYWDQQNIQNYLQATIPTEQTELTFCFYYGPNSQGSLPAATDSSEEAWIMSIATKKNDNSFIIGIRDLHLYMHLESSENWVTDRLEAFTEPHRHCIVWKNNEYMKWFYDQNTSGKLELVAEVGDSGLNSIPAGSSITILNEQDNEGGELDTYQMMPGLVADFQIWSRALSNDEVTDIGCGERGDLLTFDQFEIVGQQKMEGGSAFHCDL